MCDQDIYVLCPGFEYDRPKTGGWLYLNVLVDALKEHLGSQRVRTLNLVASSIVQCGLRQRLSANWKYLKYFLKLNSSQCPLVMVDSRTHSLLLLPILYLRLVKRVSIGMTAYHMYYRLTARRGLPAVLEQLSESMFLRCASFIITISRATQDQLQQIVSAKGTSGPKIYLVAPGIKPVRDPNVLKGELKAKEVLSLLYVGSCSDQRKGLTYLIEAMSMLPDSNIRLTLAGNYRNGDTYYQQLRSLIQERDQEGRISFTSWISDKELEALYHTSDLFVFPSLWEGYGIALAEAMSHALPIVATNVGAIPEIVSDGENGILVPPRDPRLLAEAIETLAKDPPLRQRMASNSLKLAKQFRTWEQVKGELVKVICSRSAVP